MGVNTVGQLPWTEGAREPEKEARAGVWARTGRNEAFPEDGGPLQVGQECLDLMWSWFPLAAGEARPQSVAMVCERCCGWADGGQ